MKSTDLVKRQILYTAVKQVSHSYIKKWLILLVFAHWLAEITVASSVQQVTMAELVGASELVFEGQVVAVQSRLEPDGDNIHTFVTFEVFEVIRGKYSERRIELSFLGGTVGDLSLRISDMHVPELGERGIYFVETLERRQVHPFYGWDQGHFLVKKDPDGTEKVITRTKRSIIGVDPAQTKRTDQLSSGVAVGLKISDRSTKKGLTVAQFKNRLRDIMRRLQ